jgi:hypothetical protein
MRVWVGNLSREYLMKNICTKKQAELLTSKTRAGNCHLKGGVYPVTPVDALMAYLNDTHRITRIDGLPTLNWSATLNTLLDSYGYETIAGKEWNMGYMNMGDTYALTLCHYKGRWHVCSWGDVVEKFPKNFED